MTEKEYRLEEDPAETRRVEAALRAPDGWPKPPAGFEERCLAAIRSSRAWSPRRSSDGKMWKIAASIAAAVAMSGLAAWIAVEALSGGAAESVDEAPFVDAETEAISKEGNMIARKTAGIVGAALTTLAFGATELESEPTFVFLRPETSSFWHTATNNVMTVPVDFPPGATSARLYVSGVQYTRTYDDITADVNAFTFELPAADSSEKENVYDLALAFNDPSETVRRAKLGLIQGLEPDAEGVTRCLAPADGSLWEKVKGRRAVLPIPYGTTSLQVNGVETPTGLDGAQGWFALRVPAQAPTTLSLIANEITYTASLLGEEGGFIIIFK